MTTIADSDAFRDDSRVLPQHQTAATLLQQRMAQPGGAEARWLDLACGRGQLVRTLDEALGDQTRGRLHFLGVDGDQRFARDAKQAGEQAGLASSEVRIGSLSDLGALIPDDERFDFITMTNTVHEVSPRELPALLATSVLRLQHDGVLFVYDVEELHPHELGAVPWIRDEVQQMLSSMFQGFGIKDYAPEVQRFPHRTTTGWSITLDRSHMQSTLDDLPEGYGAALGAMETKIAELLRIKLTRIRTGLDSLMKYGSETSEEQVTKDILLHDFWGVTRALEGFPQ